MPANVNSGAPCSQPRAGPVRLVVRDHRDVAVPDRDALRQAGRARRVHDVGEVVERRSAPGSRSRPASSTSSHASTRRTSPPARHDRGGNRRLRATACAVEQRVARQHRDRLGVAEDRDELGHGEARVGRHRDRAGLVDGGVRDDPAQHLVARQVDRDPVAVLDALVARKRASRFDCSSHSANVSCVPASRSR